MQYNQSTKESKEVKQENKKEPQIIYRAFGNLNKVFLSYFQEDSNIDLSCIKKKFPSQGLTVEWLLKKIQESDTEQRIHLAVIDLSQRQWFYGSISTKEIEKEEQKQFTSQQLFTFISEHTQEENIFNVQEGKKYYIQISPIQDSLQFIVGFQIKTFGKKEQRSIIIPLELDTFSNTENNDTNQQDNQKRIAELEHKNEQIEEILKNYCQKIQNLEKNNETNQQDNQKRISEFQQKNEQFDTIQKNQQQQINNLEEKNDKNQQDNQKRFEEFQQKNEQFDTIQKNQQQQINNLEEKNDTIQQDNQKRIAELEHKSEQREATLQDYQQRIQNLEKKLSEPLKRQVKILLHSDLQQDYVNKVLYHYSKVFSNEICRLEIVLLDGSAKFSVGICKDGDLNEISTVANSYFFEFPNGTLKRGLKETSEALKVINYYPFDLTQIGLEVDTQNKLLTLYINGEKSFLVRLGVSWEKFSFFVQPDGNLEKLNEIFDEEEKLLSY